MEPLQTWWATELYPSKDEDTFGVAGDFEVVRAADAQATIAALQARVNGLEKDSELLRQSRDDFRVKYESVKNDAITLQSQLTQRTAELEAAKGKLDIILRVSRGEPDDELAVDYGGLGWENDPAVRGVYNLQAELERAEAGYFVAERDLRGMNNKYDELRTLILALPKVEGDWTVSCALAVTVVTGGIVRDISEVVAAIVQHRQGMEG